MNLKKIGKVFTSKSVGTGPSSYEKRIYRAAVSQRLRNTGVELLTLGHPRLISIPTAEVRLCLCENVTYDVQPPDARRPNTLHL